MKKYSQMLLASVCVALVFSASTASAALLTVTFDYVNTYDSGFVPTGSTLLLPIGPGNPVDPTDIHAFNVFFEVSGLAANQNIQGLQYDFVLGAGITPDTTFGTPYFGDFPNFDPPGPAGPGPLWNTNEDAGADPLDLKRLFTTANSENAAVLGIMPGESGPFFLGQALVNIDPSQIGNPHSAISLSAVELTGFDWSLFTDGNGDAQPSTDMDLSASFDVEVIIPEPSSIALFGIALMALAGYRRRS